MILPSTVLVRVSDALIKTSLSVSHDQRVIYLKRGDERPTVSPIKNIDVRLFSVCE